jgi:hypothetical protein
MSTPFENFLRCTLGSSEFQLQSYTAEESPLITSGIGRTGTSYRVSGRGWIEGTDAADYQSKIAAAIAAFGVSGQNFTITELNQSTPFYSILAATCSEGGPHVSWKLEDQSEAAPLRRWFSFVVEAKNGSSGSSGTTTAANLLDTQAAPDATRTIGARGQINQANATAYFLGSVLAPFKTAHPASGWVVSHQYSADTRDVQLTYQISATELAAPYPDNGAMIVDGEGQIERDADEQGRLTIRYSCDFLISGGNYQNIIDVMRLEAAAKGAIIRESTRVTRFKQIRLQANFEIISGREGNALMNWQQKLVVIDPSSTWREITFVGASPILVAGGVGLKRLVQAGTAVGAGARPAPATPLYPDHFSKDSPPQVEFSTENDYEWRTTWIYSFIFEDFTPFEPSAAVLDSIKRPKTPKFV